MLESPRWLLSMKKYKRANHVVKKITEGIRDRKNLHEANKLQEIVDDDLKTVVFVYFNLIVIFILVNLKNRHVCLNDCSEAFTNTKELVINILTFLQK